MKGANVCAGAHAAMKCNKERKWGTRFRESQVGSQGRYECRWRGNASTDEEHAAKCE